MAAKLGENYNVIEEGLSARTTSLDDPNDPRLNGSAYLPTALASHLPLDLVIIMLGTNDLKPFHGHTASEAGRGMARLVQIIRGHYAQKREPEPAIILVAPPILVDTDNEDMKSHFGGEGFYRESHNFAREYRRRADEHGVHFFDAAAVANTDPRDGIHLDETNTRAIGTGLVPLVKQVLGI
jgi:lysophospholipase L1-like esterase